MPDGDVTIVSEMVFPNQTNHYGTLFGGEALKLMGTARLHRRIARR